MLVSLDVLNGGGGQERGGIQIFAPLMKKRAKDNNACQWVLYEEERSVTLTDLVVKVLQQDKVAKLKNSIC